MPQIPNSPKWSRQLSRIFSSKGSSPQVQVLDDIMPTVQLTADEADQRWARGDIAWQMGYAISAPGAGNYATVAVSAKPGYIVCVDAVFIYAGAASQFRAYVSQGALAGGTSGMYAMDARVEGSYQTNGTIQAVAYAGSAPTVGALYYSNGIFPVGAIVDNDDTWVLTMNAANTAFWCNLWGWEREVDPGTAEAG